MYTRKTRDDYDIEQRTEQGWEIVNCEAARRDAIRSLKEYRANQLGYEYRYVKRRVKIEN